MHTTINTEALRRALELVGKVSTKHVTLPVLQCVLLEVTKDKVIAKATNLEIGIEVSIDTRSEDEGMVAVSAQTLMQTISLHTEKDVVLRTEDDVLVVEGGASTTEIKTIAYDEFPTIPHIQGTGQSIHNQTFTNGLRSVVFAASQSSIKPELGSVLITQKKEQTLTFVATDSFRLMEKTVPQNNFILEESILVPYKNVLEIIRVLDIDQSDVHLFVTENQLVLSFADGVYLTSRLTAGSFPDYIQIIPKEYSTHVTVLKQDLLHTLKKTNIFLNKFFQVGLVVTGKTLTVTANSGEVGTTTESISASMEGEELTLSFNQRYLSEPLQYFSDESLTLHFAGVGRPLVMQPTHDNSVRYLVMPMNK